MFGIFSRSQRSVGIDIRSDRVRFVEIDRSHKFDRISAYGEVTFDGSEPDEASMVRYLSDIKKVLAYAKPNVAIPEGSDEEMCVKILKLAGMKPAKIVPPTEPLARSLVPNESDTSFVLVNAEYVETNFVIVDGDVLTDVSTDAANHNVISNLNRIYIEWYDAHKERVHHVLFSGAKTPDREFLDYVARETRIPLSSANVFVNLKLDPDKVPIITKDESYKYAIAIGLALC